MVVKTKKYLSIANYLTLCADAFDKAQTTSICVVARIGTHGFSLVRSMGTQNSRGVVLLAILAKRLEILAVHTVFDFKKYAGQGCPEPRSVQGSAETWQHACAL